MTPLTLTLRAFRANLRDAILAALSGRRVVLTRRGRAVVELRKVEQMPPVEE